MALTRVTKTRELTVDGKMTQLTRGGGGHTVLYRHFIDHRDVGNGTYAGYILMCPAYSGTGYDTASEVSGTFRWSRGSTSSGNRGGLLQTIAKTAYDRESFATTLIEMSTYFTGQYKVTYNGVVWFALGFRQTGGAPDNGIYFDGYVQGTYGLVMVRADEVTNATAWGGDYPGKAAIRVNADLNDPAGMNSVQMLNSPFFDGQFTNSGTQTAGTILTYYQTSSNGMSLSNSNTRLTVPVEGYYLITASQLLQPASGTYSYFILLVNGTYRYHAHNNFTSNSTDYNISKIVHLAAGDYIEFQVSITSTAWNANHSTVSVHKLG